LYGQTHGIGKAIAVKLASVGANVVIAAKTTEVNPKLEGTIYSAVEEINKAGGNGSREATGKFLWMMKY
jgi:citronellol/citronellal dehydrogenase